MISFRRGADVTKAMRELYVEHLDDPRYWFWLSTDWMELPKENESPGWSEETVEVVDRGRSVGFLTWGISRTHQKVDSVGILLRPEFLGTGAGARALACWLRYAFRERRVRKVEFSCIADNRQALRLYARAEKIGARRVGVRRGANLLRDGLFHDLVLFEIMREEFVPDAMFDRLARGREG